MRPVLLLEFNEIPLRVYRKYAADPRFPHVKKLLDEATLVETRITDEGELSPWCTWPTIHRGLSKKEHGVFHLGQDPATFRGTPIWDEVRAKGYSVGVFGSMQSWPPRDPGPGGFYVPDTFAPSPECFPPWIEPITRFNLGLVRENGRVMKGGLLRHALRLKLAMALLRARVRMGTLLRSAFHVLRERVQPSLKQRRVSYQAMIFWDVFRGLFDPENPPAFTTFFSNHVASVEHRFWNEIFPEDFRGSASGERPHLPVMDFAMGILDEILEEVFSWRDRNPSLIVVVANSMGQGPRESKKHQGFEVAIEDPAALFRLLGLPEDIKQNLAMAPQVAYDLGEGLPSGRFEEALARVTTREGSRLFLCDSHRSTVSVSVVTPREHEIASGKILVGGREVSLEDAGLKRFQVDPGTAYHVPEGQLLALGLPPSASRPEAPVKAEEVKSLLLGWGSL